MALHVLNINHSAFRSMFEKLSRLNFNDWFRLPKMVLRVEKKLFVIEQPIFPAPPADSRPFGPYVIKMKNYVVQLERLGYVLPQDLSVALILNGPTSNFTGFVRNYNMHNMGKTIDKLHKSLNAKEKGKGKGKGKDKSYILKPKNPKPSAKEHPEKDDTCHHYKVVGHWKRNFPAYLVVLIKNKKQVGTANSSDDYSRYDYMYLLKHKREVFETFKVVKNEVGNQLEKTIKPLRSNLGGEYISQEFKDYLKACGIIQQRTPPYILQLNGISKRRNHTLLDMGCEALVKRDMPDKLQQRSVKCIFIGYLKEMMGYYFYFPPKNKIVVARYAEFLEKNLLSQEISRRAKELKEIQDEDTSLSKNTSEIPIEVEVDKNSLGDLNEPANYKDAILDPKSDKWLDVINAEMQSMKDNQV
ncbi:retrotransposon protein, putative, ty1-copia subclass, partial [Tanacetum coccineum]